MSGSWSSSDAAIPPRRERTALTRAPRSLPVDLQATSSSSSSRSPVSVRTWPMLATSSTLSSPRHDYTWRQRFAAAFPDSHRALFRSRTCRCLQGILLTALIASVLVTLGTYVADAIGRGSLST